MQAYGINDSYTSIQATGPSSRPTNTWATTKQGVTHDGSQQNTPKLEKIVSDMSTASSSASNMKNYHLSAIKQFVSGIKIPPKLTLEEEAKHIA